MRSNVIAILISLVVGVATVFLARQWLFEPQSQPAKIENTLVVATAPLSFGAVLSRDNVREIPWASAQIPEGGFSTVADLLKDGKRVVLSSISKNEPILQNKITGQGQRATLSAILQDGMRAVTIRVDDVRGVAGFILPGERVDVVLIRSIQQTGSAAENVSEIIMQYIRVLAVDQIMNDRQEAPTVAKAVTLEVTPEQAQKLILANNIGKLSLVLRHARETGFDQVRSVTEDDLTSEASRVQKPSPSGDSPTSAPTTPDARPAKVTIEVVRGQKTQSYDVVSPGVRP